MQNVPPLPNEHVLGHLVRVAGANAVKNLKALFRSTRSDDDNEDIHPLHWKHRYYGPLRYGNTTSLRNIGSITPSLCSSQSRPKLLNWPISVAFCPTRLYGITFR